MKAFIFGFGFSIIYWICIAFPSGWHYVKFLLLICLLETVIINVPEGLKDK